MIKKHQCFGPFPKQVHGHLVYTQLEKNAKAGCNSQEEGKRNVRQKGHIDSTANLHPLQSSVHGDRQMSSSPIH